LLGFLAQTLAQSCAIELFRKASRVIRNRGGYWQVKVYAGLDPLTGKQRFEYDRAKTKREAGRVEAALKTKVAEGRSRGTAARTVADLVERWYEWRQGVKEISPTTLEGYRRQIDQRIIPALGRIPVRRLDVETLDGFYAELRRRGKAGGEPLSASTVRAVHTVLSGSLRQAVAWGWIPHNPARLATPPSVPREVAVTATPEALAFIDVPVLEAITGFPVRHRWREPEEPESVPEANAIVVAPATFNTINRWVAGTTNTVAVGTLCESLGLDAPIVAVPNVNPPLARHPTFRTSLHQLREWGVRVLFEESAPREARMPPWEEILEEVNQAHEATGWPPRGAPGPGTAARVDGGAP